MDLLRVPPRRMGMEIVFGDGETIVGCFECAEKEDRISTLERDLEECQAKLAEVKENTMGEMSEYYYDMAEKAERDQEVEREAFENKLAETTDMALDLQHDLAECQEKLKEAEAQLFEARQAILTEGLARDEAEAREARLREALREIRDGRKPQVCAEYELCTHEGCRASYEAFIIADKALGEEVPCGSRE
jgi:hypothetical protein